MQEDLERIFLDNVFFAEGIPISRQEAIIDYILIVLMIIGLFVYIYLGNRKAKKLEDLKKLN